MAASPWPPPRATTRARGPHPPGPLGESHVCVDVPVHHADPLGVAPQAGGQLLGDRHRAVAPAGAAERDGQVGLPLGHVGGQQLGQQALDVVEERAGHRLAQDVVAHRLVEAGERAQLVDPERVGQEPAVEHEVGVEGQAVLVPERQQRRLHRRGRLVALEQVPHPPAQLVDVERGRVDDDVRRVLDRVEQRPLALDGRHQQLLAAPAGQRVPAPGRLVAADQAVGRGVEEQHPHLGPGGPQPGQRGQDLVLVVPGADDERHPVDLRPRGLGQLDHLGHQLGRQVVDHEPAEVLQVVGRQAAAGPGEARDDDELFHLPGMIGLSAARPAGAATGGWWRRPRTRRPGPGTPGAAPARPCGRGGGRGRPGR